MSVKHLRFCEGFQHRSENAPSRVKSTHALPALLLLLVTYFLFAELRTYPGKAVMHLSCAMIGMQSVYFLSDPDVVSPAVCAVMGALFHYFILVVFLWMSAKAHNTQKTFTFRVPDKPTGRKLLLKVSFQTRSK